jgi:hypothetical protein
MSTSTDAIMVYGIPLKEDALEEWDEDRNPESGPAYLAFMGGADGGICVVSHCSGDYPMHIIAIEGTELRAWRGSPKPVAVVQMRADDNEWNKRLLDYCKAHKLKTAGKPGWWLASMWG